MLLFEQYRVGNGLIRKPFLVFGLKFLLRQHIKYRPWTIFTVYVRSLNGPIPLLRIELLIWLYIYRPPYLDFNFKKSVVCPSFLKQCRGFEKNDEVKIAMDI